MPQPVSESAVRHIIDRFGGARAFAAALFPDENDARRWGRVRNWLYERSIPGWYFDRIVEVGEAAGIEVTLAELTAIASAKKAA